MTVSEVSIVTFPAYQQTDVHVAMRSMTAFQQEHKGHKLAWLEKVQRQRAAR